MRGSRTSISTLRQMRSSPSVAPDHSSGSSLPCGIDSAPLADAHSAETTSAAQRAVNTASGGRGISV